MPVSSTLITGASAGIGSELARQFAAGGSNLILVARRIDKLNSLADELRTKRGTQVVTVELDLADRKARQSFYDKLQRDGTRVDALVNCAGFGFVGKVADISLQKQLDMVEVNVAALIHLTRLFLLDMIARQSGGILNVASTAAFQAGPSQAVYFASKAFVLSFTEALAEELAGTGVRVTCLCPGPTVTEFAEKAGLEKSLLFRMSPMSAAAVAEVGYQAFRKRKLIVVPGIKNWLGTIGAHLSPRFLSRKIAARLNQ